MDQNKTKVLVVEDEEILLTALTEELKIKGFDVVGARDGVEGLEKTKSEQPDLILLDLVMPKLDGISTLKELKGNPETQGIPVVILTNLSDYDKISEALALGAKDYLVKANYRLEDLVEKIRAVLERKGVAEAPTMPAA